MFGPLVKQWTWCNVKCSLIISYKFHFIVLSKFQLLKYCLIYEFTCCHCLNLIFCFCTPSINHILFLSLPRHQFPQLEDNIYKWIVCQKTTLPSLHLYISFISLHLCIQIFSYVLGLRKVAPSLEQMLCIKKGELTAFQWLSQGESKN